jgi:hypothetical protein
MNWQEYCRFKVEIEAMFAKKMEALKIIYPHEWKKDHAPKGGSSASKGAPRSGHRVGAKRLAQERE